MPYNDIVSRTDVQPLIPEAVSQAMLTTLTAESAALQLATRIPVPTNQTRFPILSALPTAYWVNGDTGLKQTSDMAWTNKFLNIEELAVIVPVPDAVAEDVTFNIWDNAQPLMTSAIVRAFDAAVFFGVNAPASFPDDVVTSAVAAGNVVARGTNNVAAGGLAQDASDLYGTLEADGYSVTGAIASMTMRGRFRSIRSSEGVGLSDQVGQDTVWGTQVQYPMMGLWPTGLSAAEMIVGEFGRMVVGVRRDMTFKLLDQAVITDNTGTIIYNLAQQDMTALRLTFRAGWEVSNPINYQQPTAASRYPFAILRSPAA